jgi:hypothetical protein
VKDTVERSSFSPVTGRMNGHDGFGPRNDLAGVSREPLVSQPSLTQLEKDPCPVSPIRCPFGGACHTCPTELQPKLKIGQPDDEYEREADRVAETVMSFQQADLKQNMTDNAWEVNNPLWKITDNQYADNNRYSDMARTECDVKVHPDDINYYLLGKSFRTVGTGNPFITVLIPELKSKSPCLYQTGMAHEQQHVKNSTDSCKSLKKCVDEKTSRFLLLGRPEISKDDFEKCYASNNGGLMKDCVKDEKSAYEIQIKKAKQLATQPECKGEKDILERNIKYWESIKDNAPNCKTKSRKVTFQPVKSSVSFIARHSPQTQTGDQHQVKVMPPIVNEVLHSPGQPLDAGTRAFMEPRFGHDFSKVRIHTDTQAADSAHAVNALAYTVGNDVVFGSGQYQPATSNGRRLLGHELTHVVQQNKAGAKIIQKAIECSLNHIDEECNNAASRCASIQESYCEKKYPKPEDIEKLYKNAIDGAKRFKTEYPNAADNLLHFLDGSGTEKTMNYEIFRDDKATKDKLENEHRTKFIEGAKKRIKSGELKPGTNVEMTWTGTANAFSFLKRTDLGIAVGGYTLCSKVIVSIIEKTKGTYVISFDKWTVQAFDCYNWDPGKGIGITGATDNDLCCLQNAKKAKHFKIRTNSWENTYAPSIASETITL